MKFPSTKKVTETASQGFGFVLGMGTAKATDVLLPENLNSPWVKFGASVASYLGSMYIKPTSTAGKIGKSLLQGFASEQALMSDSSNIAKENLARINKALYFIDKNLDRKLLLEDIAKEAYFSPYHFHRLFSVVMGETPNEYITRKKIERAASYFLNKKDISVTEASERTGFSSISTFSRAFKKFYGLSPQEFKEQSPEKFSKICKTESKNGQIEISFEQYIRSIQQSINWIQMNATTEIKTIQEFQLAYVSHVGKIDHIGNAFDSLIRWATPKGLMTQENLRMVTIYHDSPKISDPNHLRMSACMILNEPVKVEGEVDLRTLEATKCIVSHFEITPFEFQQAWESNFVWMTEHGYKKADKDPFEIYYNNYIDHPEKKFIVDLCIPIQ